MIQDLSATIEKIDVDVASEGFIFWTHVLG